jgi:hypothetical protein
MNYELMDYAVAAVLAEKFAKKNDKEGLRNFLTAFEGAKLDLALKTKKLGIVRSSLNKFLKAFFKKYPLVLA